MRYRPFLPPLFRIPLEHICKDDSCIIQLPVVLSAILVSHCACECELSSLKICDVCTFVKAGIMALPNSEIIMWLLRSTIQSSILVLV
jgi:hypothetical protein